MHQIGLFKVESGRTAVVLAVTREALIKFGTKQDAETRKACGRWCAEEVERRMAMPDPLATCADAPALKPGADAWPPATLAPDEAPPF